MQHVRLCRLRVVVPHFYRESENPLGYGSTRVGTRLARTLALGRCLAGVLALNRQPTDLILNLAEKVLELTPSSPLASTRLAGVKVELHLFVTGENYLQEVAELYGDRLTLHHLELEDPLQLPLAAADWLRRQEANSADLHLYLEDDLVIADPRYVDKLAWFSERTEHRMVLMPHRVEFSAAQAPLRLFVDGPVKPLEQQAPVWAEQERELARGTFWDGRSVGFAEASNPHSGSFCLSEVQRRMLQESGAAPTPFVGPLETAATGTVLGRFPVLKPMWGDRDFLTVEHGHPSFLRHVSALTVRETAVSGDG
jgi:hypothetical protein